MKNHYIKKKFLMGCLFATIYIGYTFLLATIYICNRYTCDEITCVCLFIVIYMGKHVKMSSFSSRNSHLHL